MNERKLFKKNDNKNNSAGHFCKHAENSTFSSPAGSIAGLTAGAHTNLSAGSPTDSPSGMPAGLTTSAHTDLPSGLPTGSPTGSPAGSPANRPRQARRLRRELAVLAGLLLALFLSNFTGFASACAEVRADTLRLHILANSDSEADQALKLAVRDAILAEAGGLFASGQTKQEALDAARQSLPMLQAIAEETLRANGCTDAVSVRLEELYFETREYEDFTLPAGRYDAVRIEIGAHEGKNWFCVLFPPLCLPAASDEDAPDENTPAYSEAEQNAIHSPYRIRFAAVELLEGWREALRPNREDVAK